VAPISGTVTIDTIGSSFNTMLGVYTGTLGSLTTIADNNDIGGGTNTSRVTFTATAGTEYKILVGGTRISGSNYNTGTIQLHIFMPVIVSLNSPTNGSYYAYGVPINFSANLNFTITNIQRFEFYGSSTLLGSATNSPYSLVVNNLAAGQYQCYAVAIDSSNTKATSQVATVTILNTGVIILSPTDGTSYTNTNSITITAKTAILPSGTITNVGFYVNGGLIGTAVTSISNPTCSIDWTNVISGVHKLTAQGWADSGTVYTSAPVYIAVAYTLVPSNSVWKYLDNGVDQGTAWQLLDFDDSSWAEGMAELGYGDSADGRPENTVLSYGPDENNKYPTYYFRKKIVIPDPSIYTNFIIYVMRDDGAVVYINGQEAARFNMPSGTITYTTLTSNAADDGQIFYPATIPTSMFVPGTNIIAVEIHQTANSTDISFDFVLTGIPVIVKNQSPIVTLNSPTNNAYYVGPKSIVLDANATDPDGFVVRVDFYVDDVLIGSATNAPYNVQWQNPTVGTHIVKAIAIDNLNGSSKPETVSVVVFDSFGSPIVTITSPKDQTVYDNLTWWTNVNFAADVISLESIKNVKFYANNSLIGSATNPPYTLVWSNATFGTNLIVATAENASGIIGTSKPITVILIEPPHNTNPPVIASVSPSKGLIIAGLTNIQVIFSEDVTGVDASDLLVNGVPAISVSGSGSNYVFTVVQPSTYGIVYITWATNHGITDFGFPSG
ncbi:MAG TPA: Ig-like domain-containing protein, partial [Verrucomicrobiota bacterium]|nr:Ig-like domain-containing protein [Verrucomicrobiota bacterium]